MLKFLFLQVRNMFQSYFSAFCLYGKKTWLVITCYDSSAPFPPKWLKLIFILTVLIMNLQRSSYCDFFFLLLYFFSVTCCCPFWPCQHSEIAAGTQCTGRCFGCHEAYPAFPSLRDGTQRSDTDAH